MLSFPTGIRGIISSCLYLKKNNVRMCIGAGNAYVLCARVCLCVCVRARAVPATQAGGR